MRGMLSNYPKNYDVLVNFLSENKAGYSKAESRVIPESLELQLANYAKVNTVTIGGYEEVFSESQLQANKFYISNYKVPVYTLTEIDFQIANKIKFYQDNAKSLITISYTTVGSKVSSMLFNWIFDCIYSIEHAIGTLGKNKDLEIGNYKNLGQYIEYLFSLIQNHTHNGIDSPLLNENIISPLFLTNNHFDDNANIAQSKIENGQFQFGSKTLSGYELTIDTPSIVDDTCKCVVIPEIGHDTSKYPIYPYYENGVLKIKCAKPGVKFDYIIYK